MATLFDLKKRRLLSKLKKAEEVKKQKEKKLKEYEELKKLKNKIVRTSKLTLTPAQKKDLELRIKKRKEALVKAGKKAKRFFSVISRSLEAAAKDFNPDKKTRRKR